MLDQERLDLSGERRAVPPTDSAFSIQRSAFHFIGLGGIGMSALARVLLQKGCKVQGSDAAGSPLLQQLEKEGAKIRIGHSADWIDRNMTVVYSTDIKENNVELRRAKELGLPLLHRSEMLDSLMKSKKTLLVTGTHGKTTTTALLASVLCQAGSDPSFVVGGIIQSMNTNGKAGNGDYFAAEADESDGSFLKTAAFGSIVTNLENEHLNYWISEQKLDAAFETFFEKTLHPEHLFWCFDDLRLRNIKHLGISYGFSENADLKIYNYRQNEAGIAFDLHFRDREYRQIDLALFGRHNALNAAAVFGLALSLNISESAIRDAFRNFLGTKRRLELKGESGGVALYDDYGHHPTEIAVTLKALRDRAQKRRLLVVFQPHRYSRVRDLLEEFSQSFEDANHIILTDIYSAGESPIPGISTEILFKKMKEKLGRKLEYIPRSDLEFAVAGLVQPADVVLTIGAGDVTRAGEPILKLIAQKQGDLNEIS